jgi:hypothetical protein
MKVIIDGTETKVLNDVKIIWENNIEDTSDHLTVTSEGVIVDVTDTTGEIIETQSCEVNDLFSMMLY